MNTGSGEETNRLRADLDVMQTAAGLGPRYGSEDVGAFTGYGAGGLLLAVWGSLPGGRALPGWGMGLFFVVCAGVWAFYARRNHRRPSHSPARLREARLGIGFLTLSSLAMMGCLLWSRWQGLPRGITVGAAFALGGLLAAVFGLTDRWRRLWLGFAGPLVGLGALWPALPEAWWNLAFGLAYAVGCWLAATTLRWQLRALPEGLTSIPEAGHAH